MIDHKFTQPEAARLADVKTKDIQNWLMRDVIVGHKKAGVTGGGVKGVRRKFSFNAVTQLALMGRLVLFGLPLETASIASASFAHTGNAKRRNRPERLPGFPFNDPRALTYLALNDTGDFRYLLGRPDIDIYAKAKTELKAFDILIIDVSRVFAEVCQRYGMDAQTVMKEAYRQ